MSYIEYGMYMYVFPLWRVVCMCVSYVEGGMCVSYLEDGMYVYVCFLCGGWYVRMCPI